MIYVGLTDDLERRRAEHGNPPDWRGYGPFQNPDGARAWEQQQLAQPNRRGGTGGAGWRFGYMYTITSNTRE